MIWSLIPIIGDLVKGIFGIVSKTVVDKDKANELTKELTAEFMGFLEKYREWTLQYEGRASDLAHLGWAGKIVTLLRCGWRPILQWALAIDILYKLWFLHVPWQGLTEEILFAGGLAGLRTIEKKLIDFPRFK